MARSLRVLTAIGFAAALVVGGGGFAAAVDEILLRNGERLMGELQETQFSLRTPEATYRVTRESAWRLVLNRASGDAVDLRNGNRLSGLLDHGRYTIRLAGGRTEVVPRAEIEVLTLGAAGGMAPAGTRDVLVLTNGNHVYGNVVEPEFDLVLDTGTQRFARDAVWRILLDTINGDSVELLRGDRLSGLVDRARYSIRTSDGQLLTFGRAEIIEVMFRLPERAAARPGARTAATGPAGAGRRVAAVPSVAVPPPLQQALRDIHFEFDRWELTPDARGTLEDLADAMKAFPDFTLLIEGHADERGTPEYNLALGERRAQAARDYLVNLGIEQTRINVLSYGEERPLDPAQNEVAWTLNRRAHFVVTMR